MEVFAAAGGGAFGGSTVGRFGLLRLEVVEVGLAEAAADDVEMELDVGGFFVGQGTEQMAAELLARGATETIAAPDFAERVDAGVAAVDEIGELRGKQWIVRRASSMADMVAAGSASSRKAIRSVWENLVINSRSD